MSLVTGGMGSRSFLTGGLSPLTEAGPGSLPTIPYAPPTGPFVSDRMPDGGYLLPLYPRSFFRDPVVAAQVLGLIDVALDLYRQATTDLASRHAVGLAQGQALDRFFGALLDVPRLTNESDDAYGARIMATARHGVQSVTPGGLAAALGAILGVPVTAMEGPGPARGTLTILQNTAVPPQTIMAFVRQLKPFGVVVAVRVRTAARRGTEPGPARLGAFRLGTRVLSGSSSFVTIG